MSIWDSLKIAVQTIKVNKVRASLIMLAVTVGVSAVVLLVSIGNGAKSDITQRISGMGSNIVIVMPSKVELGDFKSLYFDSSISMLNYDDVKAIEDQATTIDGVTPILERNIDVWSGNESGITKVRGVTAAYCHVINQAVESGVFITNFHVDNSRKVCILGKTVADNLFTNTENIGKEIRLGEDRYTVIGIMERMGSFMGVDNDDMVYIPITSALSLTGINRMNLIMVKAKDAYYIEDTVTEIRSILSKRHSSSEFSVVTQKEMLGLFQEVTGTLTLMLGGIAAISLAVSCIGILNVMLMAVLERRREIGIRKAVGARSRDIMLQFLIESTALSTLGGIIGLIVGLSVALLLRSVLPTQVDIWLAIIAFIAGAIVGIISGIFPAWRAAQQDPVIALRYE